MCIGVDQPEKKNKSQVLSMTCGVVDLPIEWCSSPLLNFIKGLCTNHVDGISEVGAYLTPLSPFVDTFTKELLFTNVDSCLRGLYTVPYSRECNWRTITAIFLREKIQVLRPYLMMVRLTKIPLIVTDRNVFFADFFLHETKVII